MASASITIPSSGLVADSGMGTKDQVSAMLKEGIKKYGNYFKFASQNSKLPIEMLIAFGAVESGVGRNIGSAGHVTRGIMQWNREYAKSQLEKELALKRMTPAEKNKLASFGIKFDANGKTRAITEADQIKPELNILVGSIILGQLADSIVDGNKETPAWGTDKGIIRLDRMIAVYNAGAYGKTGKLARQGKHANPLALANALKSAGNNTTYKYIARLMGKGGYYDLLLKDLKSSVAPYKK